MGSFPCSFSTSSRGLAVPNGLALGARGSAGAGAAAGVGSGFGGGGFSMGLVRGASFRRGRSAAGAWELVGAGAGA